MNDHLYRLRDDRMIAGVAGGVAERFGLDPSLVRIVWLLLVPLTGGAAFIAYIVMAVVVPEEDPSWGSAFPGASWSATGGPVASPSATTTPAAGAGPEPGAVPGTMPPPMFRQSWREQRRAERAARRASRPAGSGGMIAGVILIVIGAWFLVREYVPALDPDRFWPVVLIVIGLLLLVLAFGRRGPTSPPEVR